MGRLGTDYAVRQAANAASNRVRGAGAAARREMSVVRQANRLFNPLLNDEKPREHKKTPRKDGVYTAAGETAAQILPDGYVRRSPVQVMLVAKDYRARIIKRVLMAVVGLAAAVVVIYLLLNFINF